MKSYLPNRIAISFQNQVLTKYLAGGISGFDKGGHVIFIADFGSLDSRGKNLSECNENIKTHINMYTNPEMYM